MAADLGRGRAMSHDFDGGDRCVYCFAPLDTEDGCPVTLDIPVDDDEPEIVPWQKREHRVVAFERRCNPAEREGFCSSCFKMADATGKLDGVLLRTDHYIDPDREAGRPKGVHAYYFLCLDCARAIGKAAR
jgi:hypothetical protein